MAMRKTRKRKKEERKKVAMAEIFILIRSGSNDMTPPENQGKG